MVVKINITKREKKMKVQDLLIESGNKMKKFDSSEYVLHHKPKETSEFALYVSPNIDDSYVNSLLDDFNLGHIGKDVNDVKNTKHIIKHLHKHLDEKGVKSKFCKGYFKTDKPDYWGVNFTEKMNDDMIQNDLNPKNDIDVENFVKEFFPHIDFTKFEHCRVES